MLRELQQPDKSWDWAYKMRLALSDRRYEACVIEFDDLVQGVVLIETQWHRSWLPQDFPWFTLSTWPQPLETVVQWRFY
ncbi:MAG: hypothetical protein F6J95_027865 [Leptolyngbya sp. SIO1E4]|nr:hypothetical protein [Leptolyngbya sp. SIO1E4]